MYLVHVITVECAMLAKNKAFQPLVQLCKSKSPGWVLLKYCHLCTESLSVSTVTLIPYTNFDFFFQSWRWRGLILFCGWKGDAPPPMDRTLGSSHRDTIWVTWWHTSRNEYTGTLVWWRSMPHKTRRSNGCTFHRGQSWRFVWLLNVQNVLVISTMFINHLYSNVGVPFFII